jgi:hypothetical protein
MNINRNYHHGWNNYGSGGINVRDQFQSGYSAAQSKADPGRSAILSGFHGDLIAYFKRFKFLKQGHLGLFT